MQVFLTLIVVIGMGPLVAYGQTFSYAEETAFAIGSNKGEVAIKVEGLVAKRGDLYAVEYTFQVTNSSYAVYNWQFLRLKPLPGQLAIYDSNKKYIGDLIGFVGGSRAGISDEDWTFLYGGARVGTSLGFRAGFVSNTRFDSTGNQLPVGSYYIQLIMYKAFLSPNPFRVLGEKIDFYKTFDRTELCRSNIIKIEIVNR